MLDEQRGSALLKRHFESAGYQIAENHPYEVAGRIIRLDGFDPARRVGYEFLTSAAGDRAELSADVVAALEEQAESGQAFVLLVDEVDAPDEADLELAARRFLAEVGKRR